LKDYNGKVGEDRAAEYLIRNDYSIVEKNLRIGGSEIDIIATKEDFLVFVEVKSRLSSDFGYPEEFVDEKKKKKIIDGAKLFSVRKKYREMLIRFDVIAVNWGLGNITIEHYENAFEYDG
jgi:putative endonuclease